MSRCESWLCLVEVSSIICRIMNSQLRICYQLLIGQVWLTLASSIGISHGAVVCGKLILVSNTE